MDSMQNGMKQHPKLHPMRQRIKQTIQAIVLMEVSVVVISSVLQVEQNAMTGCFGHFPSVYAGLDVCCWTTTIAGCMVIG